MGIGVFVSEETVQCQRVFQGSIIQVEQLQVRLPNGSLSRRDIVRHSGAVCAAVRTTEDRWVLVRQYRKAPEKFLLEVPAGKIDGQENPAEAIVRELQEEIGYVSGPIQHLLDFYTAPGFCDEKLYGYLVNNATLGPNRLDEGEFLDVHQYSTPQLLELLTSGQIEDAKTLTLCWAALAHLGYLKPSLK